MVSFIEIKKKVQHGDYQQIADSLGCSYSLVRQVVDGKRADKRNIQLAFNILLKQREDFNKQIKKLNSEHLNKHKIQVA